jgi:hypothetical protein
MLKTYQFKVSVKDASKTAKIKISGRQNLAKWALTCYGGSTHERLLSESTRPYMCTYNLSDSSTVHIFSLTSCRENIMF